MSRTQSMKVDEIAARVSAAEMKRKRAHSQWADRAERRRREEALMRARRKRMALMPDRTPMPNHGMLLVGYPCGCIVADPREHSDDPLGCPAHGTP